MENNYCVYKHTNKINGKVYIGLTGNKPEYRWNHGRNYKHNAHFRSAIEKYGWDNFEHEIIMDGLSLSNAQVIEMINIMIHDACDRRKGYNLSAGGEVIIRRNGKDNPMAKTVYIVDNETREIINVFGSAIEAAEFLKVSASRVRDIIRRRSVPVNGMDCVHKDQISEKNTVFKQGTNPNSHIKKKVKLTEPDGSVFYYNSKLEAAKENNVNKITLGFYCRGERNDPSGRRWSYCDQ